MKLIPIVLLFALVSQTFAGPLAAGICYAGESKFDFISFNFINSRKLLERLMQWRTVFNWVTGCASLAVACFSAAGAVFGVATGGN